MSRFTPGPWMSDTVDGWTTIRVDGGGQTGQTITHLFDRHGPFKNASANAQLIAAAPDLAQSVTDLLAVFRICIGHAAFAEFEAGNAHIKAARAALTKAGIS